MSGRRASPHLCWVSLLISACGGGAAGPDARPGTDDAGGSGADAAGADASPACGDPIDEEVMVPMRDGKSLAAFVRRPGADGCRVPTILIQTPYDKENARALWFGGGELEQPLFASPHYAFVVVDWRGFYGSSDAAVARPERGQDGYDAVEWIAAQPWSDGQVGTWGVSALCRVQYWTAVERPPHLVAGVPIFCAMNDSYEQYYPGGVLRREYVQTLGALFGSGSIIEQHPTKDLLWRSIESANDPGDVDVPMLVVAGWYDLDNTSSLRSYDALRADSPAAVRDLHRLLIGDWHHFAVGGESAGGRMLTEQELRYWDADRTIQRDSLAWFDRHLRGAAGAADDWAEVRYLLSGEPTWADADRWPPAGQDERALYLTAGGALADAAPLAGTAVITSDPADPSPSIGGQTLRPDLLHGPQDQAAVIARADAAVFTGAALSGSLTVRGVVRVELELATSGADTDVAIRITDVGPDGAHLLVGEGIRRLSLRDDLGVRSQVTPGARTAIAVQLQNELAYRFAAGHRVGLIVTAANAPRFDPNPGTGADFFTTPEASAVVTNTIYLDGSARLLLPVDP